MLKKVFNLINRIKRVFFPFYKDKELKFVFQKLQEGLPKDKIAARFVGGCVRKYLSNDDIDDIDIATTLSSEEIKERFNNTNFRVVDTGIEHGTITLVSKKHKLEITTLRKDVETDGRHAEVEYIDDWKLDSERRDFTINSIYADLDGNLFDPYNGKKDIERIKHIRKCIGDDKQIRIDANQGWNIEEAIDTLKNIDKYKIEYCEEPINRDLSFRLNEVKESSPVKIMADESLFTCYD